MAEHAEALEPIRLTDNPTRDYLPRWTNDGRIRFQRTGANGLNESWIMHADGTDISRSVDFPGPQNGTWSPDGTKVFFFKPNQATTLYLANADGSNEIALPFVGGNHDWSPDSKQIIYQDLVNPNPNPNPNSDIFVYSLETGKSRNVTGHTEFDADPTFSPDGNQIAFVSSRDGNAEIYLMDADGRNLRRLTDHPAWDSHPVFSPDGTQIAFDSDREKEQSGIFILNTDGSGKALRLIKWDRSNEAIEPGGWSPDGTRIAFTSDRSGSRDICVISAEVFRPVKILADEQRNLGYPSYSPDGKSVVYQVETQEKSGELRIFNLDTKQSRLVLTTENPDFAPAWSPDGEVMAFQNNIDGNTEIYTIKPDGSGLKNLTNHSVKDAAPAWSPDGEKIVFSSNRDGNFGVFQVYVMNADGTGQHRIYHSDRTDQHPSWSPDGKEIVFARDIDGNGNFEIFSVRPERASAERRLTFRRRYDILPAFSPDGNRIAFASDTDGNSEIYIMNRDGSGLLRLTRNLAIDGSPRWSPDGKRLVFSSNRVGKFAIYEIAVASN